MQIKITGGRLYDPAQGLDGNQQDLFIQGDRIVSSLEKTDRVISAPGRVVAPGGIDLRGQVATYGLNFLRLWHGFPSLQELGRLYAAQGYTHVHEPFLTLYTAGYVHRQLAAIPLVDTSASLVLNLRDLDNYLKSLDHLEDVGQTIKSLQEKTRSLDLRLLEPFVRYRQSFYSHRTLDPVKTMETLTGLALDGDLRFTLEADPELLELPWPEPRAFHLAALGRAVADDRLLELALARLEEGVTADLGFEPPGAAGKIDGKPVKIDLGGYSPLNLNPPGGDALAALRLALAYQGPGLAFSLGGPLRNPLEEFPPYFAWLWDRKARPPAGTERLAKREFSLSEWVWATRTLPAKILGLADRGHLAPGARADVAIFDLNPDAPPHNWIKGLSRCHTLLKAGEVVLENYELVAPEVSKATYYRRTGADEGPLLSEICQYRSIRPENLWVPEELGGAWVGLD
ncbi:MAG: amidohydrolase family protein [Thermodesulfobacteriota bacterium]